MIGAADFVTHGAEESMHERSTKDNSWHAGMLANLSRRRSSQLSQPR